MKLYGLAIVRAPDAQGAAPEHAKILASAINLGGMVGYFYNNKAKQFMFLFARTLAVRTPVNQRQTVSSDDMQLGVVGHVYNKAGLCGIAFTDAEYPALSASCVVNKLLNEYQASFRKSWVHATSDSNEHWDFIEKALVTFQDPMEADTLVKVQKELNETRDILSITIDKMLQRGETLDNIVQKSADLSAGSLELYKKAKSTNQCCGVL